jgi:hypothetical protein
MDLFLSVFEFFDPAQLSVPNDFGLVLTGNLLQELFRFFHVLSFLLAYRDAISSDW